MDTPRTQRFLIVENDTKYAQWLQHAVSAGWPNDSIVIMDWSSFGRVRTAMTVRDYDIVMLALAFDEGIEEPTTDGFDWIRKLRSQPGFPEMIILGEGGSELAAIRTLRLGAADYLPKRLLTPPRLQRSIKITLRAIEKDVQRRAERLAQTGARPELARPDTAKSATDRHAETLTGSVKVTPGALSSNPGAPATPAHISTHTGASLAKAAAQLVTPPKSAAPATVTPPTAPPLARAHIATHTGASLAVAAKAALAMHGSDSAPAAVPVVDSAAKDPAAVSLPAASLPASREPKPIAPAIHHIPGYTILQKIGESEAAAVYLAIAEDLGHNVALKVCKRKFSGGDVNDSGARQIMFQREFEAIAALDHSSIIDLFDYGIHEGVEYLAMEYFPCGDLKARLQNPLTADEAIDFLREIARSLKVVHDAGIIHRDLKPPNVMLRDNGHVVLIDFGLARSLLGGDSSTRTGVLRGSPYYMSPEQAQGEALDARTDLYSLGVILYEMLAGKKPYLGASAIDVLQQHVMAPVPELPMHHLAYQPLLERLMSKSREQRIASCDELLAALEQMSHAMSDSGIIDPGTLVSAGSGT
jgi:tRNA A-37 threonylcarbamoyl transferase component Bud32/DNA-binding response OmpR family regulator